MFSLESPYLTFEKSQIKAPAVEEDKLPSQGDPYREWLDTATSHQPGPSVRYMNQKAGQNHFKKKYVSGEDNELVLGYGKNAYKNKGGGGDDEKKSSEEKQLTELTSQEIGTEFVDSVSSGLSSAMMDPNRRNKIHAFKTNDILNQLQPEFSKNLDGESKRRYDQWSKGDMKPYGLNTEKKALPEMRKIDPKLVTMTTTTKAKVNLRPSLPDI
mmetsp:Transcript_22688/g.36423  ORF Transcript_22688/g.36423 Transcript_22688/m.36423 type:complete len:213 (+) Transcript_22688:1-639(+)